MGTQARDPATGLDLREDVVMEREGRAEVGGPLLACDLDGQPVSLDGMKLSISCESGTSSCGEFHLG